MRPGSRRAAVRVCAGQEASLADGPASPAATRGQDQRAREFAVDESLVGGRVEASAKRRQRAPVAEVLQTRISAGDQPVLAGLFFMRQERFELPTFGSVETKSVVGGVPWSRPIWLDAGNFPPDRLPACGVPCVGMVHVVYTPARWEAIGKLVSSGDADSRQCPNTALEHLRISSSPRPPPSLPFVA